MAQLFHVSQFYTRLLYFLLWKVDFFDTPGAHPDRVRKRGFQLGCLLGSQVLAHWVGYRHHEDARPLRRSLPMALALGVVVARTTMSLFDYVSHQVLTF